MWLYSIVGQGGKRDFCLVNGLNITIASAQLMSQKPALQFVQWPLTCPKFGFAACVFVRMNVENGLEKLSDFFVNFAFVAFQNWIDSLLSGISACFLLLFLLH